MKAMILAPWLAASALAIGLISMNDAPIEAYVPINHPFFMESGQDTLPKKKMRFDKNEFNMDELDRSMKELDKAMINIDKEINIDMVKAHKEIALAMEQVKNIDVEKIYREAIASIDMVKMKKEIAEAMEQVKNIDVEKIHREAVASIDMKKMKEEIAEAQKKMKTDFNFEGLNEIVKKSLEGAKKGIEAAKKELQAIKSFTDDLEKDGLINKKKGYSIAIKDHKLIIDGKTQPEEVNKRYNNFMKDREDFTITSDGKDRMRV